MKIINEKYMYDIDDDDEDINLPSSDFKGDFNHTMTISYGDRWDVNRPIIVAHVDNSSYSHKKKLQYKDLNEYYEQFFEICEYTPKLEDFRLELKIPEIGYDGEDYNKSRDDEFINETTCAPFAVKIYFNSPRMKFEHFYAWISNLNQVYISFMYHIADCSSVQYYTFFKIDDSERLQVYRNFTRDIIPLAKACNCYKLKDNNQ